MKHVIAFGMCMLILIGCGTNVPWGNNQEEPETLPELDTGIQGLTMTWVKEQVGYAAVGTEFPLVLEVQNKGIHDVTNAELVFGIDRDYNKLNKIETSTQEILDANRAQLSIDAKRISNPQGDKEVIVALIEPTPLDPQSERRPAHVTVSLCYPYQTSASVQVCLDPDIGDTKSATKSCTTEDVSLSGGQGAPVAITKVETRMVRQGEKFIPQFWIHVENSAGGQLIKQDHYGEFCSKQSSTSLAKQFNLVEIEASLSGRKLICDTSSTQVVDTTEEKSTVKLRNGKDTVRCVVSKEDPMTIEQAFTAPLLVTVQYGYSTTISTKYDIEELGKY